MNFSYPLRSALEGAFCNGTYFRRGIPSADISSHIENNVFNKLFVVNICEDEFEVPVFSKGAVNYVVEKVKRDANNVLPEKVIIPMFQTSSTLYKRTSDSIFKLFLSTGETCLKVITGKGEAYYGGPGLIMDNQYHPLIMYTLSCKISKNDAGAIAGISYRNPTLYISPQVFVAGDLISKAIIKKIIPFYVSNTVTGHDSRVNYLNVFHDINRAKAKMIISDTNYIESPIAPSFDTYSDELINQLLIEHSDELINQIR